MESNSIDDSIQNKSKDTNFSLISFNITVAEEYSLTLQLIKINWPLGFLFEPWVKISVGKGCKSGIIGITPIFCLIWSKMN